MNIPILLASVMTVVTLIAHVVGGTAEFMHPVWQSNAPEFNKVGMSVIWHWVSAVLFINAIALFLEARSSSLSRPAVWIIVMQFLAFGLIFAWYGFTVFGSLFVMPQWIAFAIICALSWGGLRKQNHAEKG